MSIFNRSGLGPNCLVCGEIISRKNLFFQCKRCGTFHRVNMKRYEQIEINWSLHTANIIYDGYLPIGVKHLIRGGR